jgi:hypothetical protein
MRPPTPPPVWQAIFRRQAVDPYLTRVAGGVETSRTNQLSGHPMLVGTGVVGEDDIWLPSRSCVGLEPPQDTCGFVVARPLHADAYSDRDVGPSMSFVVA